MHAHAIAAVVIAGAVSGLAACTASPAPPDSTPAGAGALSGSPAVRLRFVDSVNLDVRDVPLLMAFDQLAAQGYVVEKTYVTGQLLLIETLARGEADVSVINNEMAWAAVAKGAGVRTVSEFTVYTAVVAAHARIQSCRDLHERPFGGAGPGGFAPLLFDLFMRSECPGIRPQILAISESASRYAALLAERVDAAMVPGEELIKLQRQSPNRFHALTVFARQFPGIRIDGLHVNRAWAERHPEAVTALVAAQLAAHRAIRADPQILYDEAAKRLSLDAATARVIADSHLQQDIWDVNGGLTYDNIQSTLDFLVLAGSLPAGMTATQVADLSPLQAVLSDIGRGVPLAENGSAPPQRAP